MFKMFWNSFVPAPVSAPFVPPPAPAPLPVPSPLEPSVATVPSRDIIEEKLKVVSDHFAFNLRNKVYNHILDHILNI